MDVRIRSIPLALTFLALVVLTAHSELRGEIRVAPSSFTLRGAGARQRLIVTGERNEQVTDQTRAAKYVSSAPQIAAVSDDGIVTPVASGTARITATLGEEQAVATVLVIDGARLLPVTFEKDVLPILGKAGCNAGACHGKSGGQNGFQLSLLGFDPDFDHGAITKEGRGRRIFPAAPENSLLLLKATATLPHGGGRRLEKDGIDYRTILSWLKNGTPRTSATDPVVTGITLSPNERILPAKGQQQLIVTAKLSDGTSADVTHLSTFQSNESAIAAVGDDGLISAGPLPGEAAIMARFMESFAVCNVMIPLPQPAPKEIYAKLPRNNFIDGHVWDKLKQLGIAPSDLCDDTTFHRRAFLDVIGRLPTPEETRQFLARNDKDKRAKLIDDLLQRPEYGDFWANKWADLLRPNPYRAGIKAVLNYDAWIRESFRKNKPYDQFVRELLTAKGSTFRNGAVTLFRDRRDPAELTTMVSQLFLGVRLECAKCHQHPFEIWGQDDFYGFAAYFARIGRKGRGVSPPISGSEEFIYDGDRGDVKHPLTDAVMPPKPLFGEAKEIKSDDGRRAALANWVVNDDNPYFRKVIVNRTWADLMGRGLVEPVDDLRATNPASNEPLLNELADEFRRQKYDLKQLIRTIMLSRVYQLSSAPNETNVGDTRNYSRHYRQRLRAEVLLDAVCDLTDQPASFSAMPQGSRAMELWTVRSQSIFLDSFGRPDPNQDPPCERTSDTTVVQALHLMNAQKLHDKVASDSGRIAKLAASGKTPKEIVDELYLLVYCRYPNDEERELCLKLFTDKDARRRAAEDIAWALINTPEFTLKD